MSGDRKLEWGLAVVKALLPIVAIGWYASEAISKIEARATEAVDKVAAAVQDVRLAQAVHERADDQRQAFTDDRISRVEQRQDGLERTLTALGIESALPADRRRALAVPPR